MKKLILVLMLIGQSAVAYELGDAPFCLVDNYGNSQCYYYSMTACRQAALAMGGDRMGYSCSRK